MRPAIRSLVRLAAAPGAALLLGLALGPDLRAHAPDLIQDPIQDPGQDPRYVIDGYLQQVWTYRSKHF